MSHQIIASKFFVGLKDSNLLKELNNKATEIISGGQDSLVFYGCSKKRFVIDHNGKSWYKGIEGCDIYGRNEVPEELKDTVQ